MRWFAMWAVVIGLLVGCGGTTGSSAGGFGQRTPTPEARKPETLLPILQPTAPAPEKPKPTTPAAASSFITAVLEHSAPDMAWITAKWRQEGDAKPVIGDWAVVIDRWPADNVNPTLSRKRDRIVARGRVLEVSEATVKIVLDRMHSEPRLEEGQLVVIRWY